ncbi:MAG: bis(5'-nucleosyl)-tetraphosphatase (symmetrical) YqeK [Ignavibacteriales bacterium]
MDNEAVINIIKGRLSLRRFEHSIQVADTARQMAHRFGADPAKAYFAGLVHDYGKGISGAELLRIAGENGFIEDDVERKSPDLLHAPVGAFLLLRDLGIKDDEVLDAVRYHTLGRIHMSVMDKIIYLADMIEPGRDFPGIERLRCIAERDLDQAMIVGIDSTLRHCVERGMLIHPRTIMARNWLLASLPEGLRL